MAEKKELTAEEVKALQAENKKLANELKAANEVLAKNAEIIKELNDQLANQESASEEVTKLKAEIATKDTLIKELNEQLKNQEKTNEGLGKYPVLSHKGKKYELVDAKSRARFEGKNVIITKETLEADPKLLEYCIKKGFACLREKGGK